MDNPFDTPLSGQADWDSGLGTNFQALERGYHVTERAGQAVSSGQVLWLNSGGFFFPFDPNSASTQPHAYAFTAAASGDSLTALAWGIVRSFDINSPLFPGQLAFSNASGFLSTATLGAPVGYGLSGRGILFNPAKPAAGGGAAAAVLPGTAIQVASYTGSNSTTVLDNASLNLALFIWHASNSDTHLVTLPGSPWDGQKFTLRAFYEFNASTPGFAHNGTLNYITVDSSVRLLGGVSTDATASNVSREWVFSQAVSGWYSIR